MFPLGEYSRLVNDIKRREDPDIPITFGLLIADYDQQSSRQYILNYIDRFNYKSGKYINFYLPGYFEEDIYVSKKIIKIDGKEYYFKREKYMEFLQRLETDFNFEYFYNPTLILIEYKRGHFSKANSIIIELDDQGSDIRKTGKFFEEIFKIAKSYVDINDFSRELKKNELKNALFNSILNSINNNLIKEVVGNYGRLKKYKLS
ncbi:hypothetical protein QUF49_02095 [Fictibacillus sp. b24]|uniref:hypothetical protein n=1 Tax=Fictibacillus sp. b24 TaxID=3055863 RepID=UPI0025A0558F|nr:hypothetical protein [Fictibacillus sp. b24]MDM5314764.1 hypothetical protein [Fictibacillus sp. b24]